MKLTPDSEPDFDLPIDLIKEARKDYADLLPPFIQEMTTCGHNTLQQVEIPTESGKLPDVRHGKTAMIVCRAWDSAGKHKFWTYDHAGTRCIVKGFERVEHGIHTMLSVFGMEEKSIVVIASHKDSARELICDFLSRQQLQISLLILINSCFSIQYTVILRAGRLEIRSSQRITQRAKRTLSPQGHGVELPTHHLNHQA